jgi:predicted glutamine amidotransferase
VCLIIAPGADGKVALLPEEVYPSVYAKNNDGFGAMWTENGRVEHVKMLGLSKDEEYAKMKELTEQHPDVIFHMRFKTHGKVIPSLCHPFRILHKSRHGKDLFFMHNGVLSAFGNNLTYGQSDTTNFKDKILVPLLTRNPDALDDPSVMEALNKMTSGNRLIFLDSNGKVHRTSESTWNNRYGLTLSNTYMLPSEHQPYTGNYSRQDNVVGFNNGAMRDGVSYSLWRNFKSSTISNQEYGMWCRTVATGLLRTENGGLYHDHGPNVPIFFDKDYVPKSEETDEIMKATQRKPSNVTNISSTNYHPSVDDLLGEELDDDVPAFDADPPKKEPATRDEQLRYARLVHNCHDGNVISRENMLADILCMGNKELLAFIKDDPETTETIFSELVEIVFEQNDILSHDPTCEDFTFDYDALTELGSIDHHQASMKMISDKRKEEYARLAAIAAEKEEAERQQPKKKNKKVA